MKKFDITSALSALEAEIQQSLPRQTMTEGHPWYGAYISPETGVDEAGHVGTSRLLASCGLLLIARQTQPELAAAAPATAELLERMSAAADYLLRVQRDTGLIDLRNVNYDSAPDTGFAVQLLCAFYDLAQDDEVFEALLPKLETFLRRAAPGLLAGGFHTPNHRWVIVAALAQTAALFPDIDVKDTVRAYLDEGFDVDEEGTYLERSIGVYDAVTNRSLLLLAEHWNVPGDLENIRTAVEANLTFNLHFFHADGTAETGLSRRQDWGTRNVPVPLIASYLHAAALWPNDLFVRAAQWLWARAPVEQSGEFWQTYVLLKYGEPATSSADLPEQYRKHYPLNKVWRVREGDLSATVYGSTSNLMSLVYGEAELASVKISQTYFGIGNFVGDELEVEGERATLHYHGSLKLHRPGYELPLGRPVARDEWEAARQVRNYKPLSSLLSKLAIQAVEGGFDCHYETLDGLENVLTQIAFDFPAGGMWETADCAVRTAPGQVMFLKRGEGRRSFGNDHIAISPGANGHLYEHMRASDEVAPGLCRVLLTFATPASHRFSLRVFRGIPMPGHDEI